MRRLKIFICENKYTFIPGVTLHLFSTNGTGNAQVDHCFGTRRCRIRIQNLRVPYWDTYNSIKTLSQQMVRHENHLEKKILLVLTGKFLIILSIVISKNNFS